MTTYIIEAGDLHTNATVALTAPNVELDDGGTYRHSRTQAWLWRSWLEFCDEVSRLPPGRKIVIFKGDLAELDTKRRTVQLISANKSTIMKTVQRTIEPLVELADSVIFIRGTPAHEGKRRWIEEAVASDYDHAVVDKEKHTSSWYHLRPVIEGLRFDISHHASMSGVPWARSNSANNLAHKIFWLYTHDMGQPAPDIVLRAHNHRIAESCGFRVLVHFSPAWTTATEYCYRSGWENTLADIGGVIWTLDDGAYSKKVITFKPAESRRIWSMTI